MFCDVIEQLPYHPLGVVFEVMHFVDVIISHVFADIGEQFWKESIGLLFFHFLQSQSCCHFFKLGRAHCSIFGSFPTYMCFANLAPAFIPFKDCCTRALAVLAGCCLLST